MTISERILQCLENFGLKDIFCLPGGGCLYLVDAIKSTKINPIFNLHEQAASICAEAYGQYTNKLGCLLVTTGPGVTNALTGVAAAYMDSTPMIILSGQCPTTQRASDRGVRQYGGQEVPTEQLVSSIVKKFYSIKETDNIDWIMSEALCDAISCRKGPVWIEVPLDVQNKPYKAAKELHFQEVLNKIQDAKKPVILVGAGVKAGYHPELLHQLLDKLNVPVLTTWKTYDLFTENHHLYCGRPGAIAERGANLVLQNCDLLVSLGARIDLPTMAFNPINFAPYAEKIIVDIDQAELDKHIFPCIKVKAHLESFLNTAIDYYDWGGYTNRENKKAQHNWLCKCKEWQREFPLKVEDTQWVSLYHFYAKLSSLLTGEDIVVLGSSGSVNEVANQGALKIYSKGTRVIQAGALGSMGFGLSGAIGACIASGKKPTICIEGDGSFAMGIQELATVKALNLPILIFVLNNNGYVSIHNSQKNLCEGRLAGVDELSGLNLPDYCNIAMGFDIIYDSLSNNKDINNNLLGLVEDWRSHKKPIICELFGNATHQTLPRTKTYKDASGQLKMTKLEDIGE